MATYFWRNLNNLKDFWSLSLTDVCRDLNKLIEGLNLTKGKLDYMLRQPSDTIPSDDVVNAVNELYCNGNGNSYDQLNICENELTAYQLAKLVTEYDINECSMDKVVWVNNFWSNFRWIEACYQQIGLSVPVWKKAGNYTYKLRKNHNILPPIEVLKEFGEWVGLTPYPMTYLKRLDGMEMLDKLIYIQNPSLKKNQYMKILSEDKEKPDDKKNNNNSLQSGQVESLNGVHSDDEKAKDLLVLVLKKRFLWTNGFLSDEKYRKLDWMIAALTGLKDGTGEDAFRKSGKRIQDEFWESICNAINDGEARLKDRWDKLNP